MFNSKKNTISVVIYLSITTFGFLYFNYRIHMSNQTMRLLAKTALLRSIHISSPAIITGGRNIAFESGTAISNAPASYLNLLDCCESDEAISSRIVMGQTRCKIIKGN